MFPYAVLLLDTLVLTSLFLGIFHFLGAENFKGGSFAQVVVTIIAMNVFALYLIGGYHHRTKMTALRFKSEHVITSVIVFFTAFFVLYVLVAFGKNVPISRAGIAMVLFAFPLPSLLYRSTLSRFLARSQQQNRLCIVGTQPSICRIAKTLRHLGWNEPIVTYDPESSEAQMRFSSFPARSTPTPVEINAREFQSGFLDNGDSIEMYLLGENPRSLSPDILKQLIHHNFNQKPVTSYESFLETEMKMVPNDAISARWIFADGFRLRKSATYLRAKRLSDLIVSTAGLVLLAPLFALIALAVKLTSRGPILFRQERIGLNEKPFVANKFRTMEPGAENGHPFTMEKDERLTSIGGILRRTRLDELPQLWNVFVGDMSLIGPRAEWSKLVRDYEGQIDYYHYRHLVRPGITGWAQVNLPYGTGAGDAVTKLHYDLYYVRHYSLLLDVSIFIKTIHIILFAQGR